jgi:hypothetical protein
MELYTLSYYITSTVAYNLILMCCVSIVISYRNNWKLYHITLYLIICLLFDLAGTVIGRAYGYNLFLTPLFGLVDYFIWTRFFIPSKTKLRKKLIWLDVILVGYIFLELIRLGVGESFMVIPSASLSNLFIVLVLIYKYLVTKRMNPRISLLVYSVVFIYVSFNCFFYIFLEFSIYWEDEYKYFIWLLRAVLLHVFYLFLPYYQWKIGRNPKHYLFG